MKSKKILETENPKMYKGQVIHVVGNHDGGPDEFYMKVATKDGYFNEFEYGVPEAIPEGGLDINVDDLATKQYVADTIAGILDDIDTSGLATKEYVNSAIQGALANVDTSDLATKQYVQEYVAGILAGIDAEGLATKEYVLALIGGIENGSY